KRNKGAATATAVAAMVLLTVVSIFLRLNYSARVRAEQQERETARAYASYEQSQQEKETAIKESLPAFVGAARQLANDGKIPEAHKQVDVALLYDGQNAPALLLK